MNRTQTKPDVDLGTYFSHALEQKSEVFEIHMDIQPRDVHKASINGRSSWVLNEKPKKRAEVHFRTLEDENTLEFLKAMKGELGSYLEHEAPRRLLAGTMCRPSEFSACVGS